MSVFSFHTFLFSYQFLRNNIEKMLLLPYSQNWQKLNKKMDEKKKPGVSEYGHPEYVTR